MQSCCECSMNEWIEILKIFVSIVGGIGAVGYWSWKTYSNNNHQYLDNLWGEMLKLYREHPKFSDPAIINDYQKKCSAEELILYNGFALTLQATMESIFDVYGKNIPDEWIHIFKYHSNLHKSWLNNNKNGFRPKFIDLVNTA